MISLVLKPSDLVWFTFAARRFGMIYALSKSAVQLCGIYSGLPVETKIIDGASISGFLFIAGGHEVVLVLSEKVLF